MLIEVCISLKFGKKKAELLCTKARPSLRNTIRGGTVRGWSKEIQGMHQSSDNYYIGDLFADVQCQIVTPVMHKRIPFRCVAIFLRHLKETLGIRGHVSSRATRLDIQNRYQTAHR